MNWLAVVFVAVLHLLFVFGGEGVLSLSSSDQVSLDVPPTLENEGGGGLDPWGAEQNPNDKGGE